MYDSFLFVLSLLFCVLRTTVTLVDPRPGFYLAPDQWWTDRLQRDRWADEASQQYVHFVLYFSWNELFKFLSVWASHLLWELENIQILYRTDPGTRILLFAFGLWDIHSTMLTLMSISSKLYFIKCTAQVRAGMKLLMTVFHNPHKMRSGENYVNVIFFFFDHSFIKAAYLTKRRGCVN